MRTLLIEQDRHSQHGNPNSRTHAHHAPGPPDACAVRTPRAWPQVALKRHLLRIRVVWSVVAGGSRLLVRVQRAARPGRSRPSHRGWVRVYYPDEVQDHASLSLTRPGLTGSIDPPCRGSDLQVEMVSHVTVSSGAAALHHSCNSTSCLPMWPPTSLTSRRSHIY